ALSFRWSLSDTVKESPPPIRGLFNANNNNNNNNNKTTMPRHWVENSEISIGHIACVMNVKSIGVSRLVSELSAFLSFGVGTNAVWYHTFPNPKVHGHGGSGSSVSGKHTHLSKVSDSKE
ncbi:hypothetical protein RFI_30760, partial [Reticulomyxa filosa]